MKAATLEPSPRPRSRPTPGQVAERRRAPLVRDLVALTKPRGISLLLVTTLVPMLIAGPGLPPLWRVLWTLLGGYLMAGGANAINMYVDRDIDGRMGRTSRRPIPSGRLRPVVGLLFGMVLGAAAYALLWFGVNLLSAALALAGIVYYVVIYTQWLKRSSTQNIVIGGAAGAAPVLIGWSAVTNTLDWPPVVLFAVIFYWTPPHFWALAVKYRDDYTAADVPMLPSVASLRVTAERILGYTLFLWGLSLVFGPVADLGAVYLVAATLLGGVFTWLALQLLRTQTTAAAMRVFGWSITYLTLLFGAIALDQLLRSGF